MPHWSLQSIISRGPLQGSNTEVSIIVFQWAATLLANHSLVFPGTSGVVSSVRSGRGAAAHQAHLRFCHVTGKMLGDWPVSPRNKNADHVC